MAGGCVHKHPCTGTKCKHSNGPGGQTWLHYTMFKVSSINKRFKGCKVQAKETVQYNAKSNPIFNPINSAKHNAITSERKRKDSLAASLLFPSLEGVVRYTDTQLHYIVDLFMRRVAAQALWATSSTYWFLWTVKSKDGWAASDEELKLAEQKEATNALTGSPNPLFGKQSAGGAVGKVKVGDFFFKGSPASLMRVAVSAVVEDAMEVESEGCRQTQRTIGLALNRKIGGAPTQRMAGNLHGVSVLHIPNLAAMVLVLGKQWRADYEARRLLGSEGVALPDEPPASFERPPRDKSGAYVLGGPRVLKARGLN